MIERHYSELLTSFESKQRMYDRLFPNRIENLKSGNNVENLGLYQNEAFDLFAHCVVENREKEETLKYLRQARDFGICSFMYTNNPGSEFVFVMEGNEFHITGGTDGAYKHVSVWLKAMYMAIILRSNNAITELCKTPEEVFQNANIKPNAFDLAMVQVLKGLFDEEADIKYWILEAFKLYDSDSIDPERRDFIAEITAPTLALYKNILTRNEQEFNEELENALMMHHEFWKSPVSRADDRSGWVSLPLLAACALAVDNKDFTITVKSDYLPEWLYKKEY